MPPFVLLQQQNDFVGAVELQSELGPQFEAAVAVAFVAVAFVAVASVAVASVAVAFVAVALVAPVEVRFEGQQGA